MEPNKVQEAYAKWAKSYDSQVNRTRDEDFNRLKSFLSDKSFEKVLELGCGTGKNTQLFADCSKMVQAHDFSIEMLQCARQKVKSSNVSFVFLDLNQQWHLPESEFDLISCNLVLEHIEVLAGVFERVAEHLVFGGTFYISELHPFKQYLGSLARFESEGKMIKVPAYVHHFSEYHDAAKRSNLQLKSVDEFHHAQDELNAPPRLLRLIFKK